MKQKSISYIVTQLHTYIVPGNLTFSNISHDNYMFIFPVTGSEAPPNRLSGCRVPTFPSQFATFAKTVVEVKALGPPHVLKLW